MVTWDIFYTIIIGEKTWANIDITPIYTVNDSIVDIITDYMSKLW